MSKIGPLDETCLDAVLALNNAHVTETSELDADELRRFLSDAFYARGFKGGADAFLIAMDQDAIYESPNFRWFQTRYVSFVYVDRIITASHARGRGLARRLYEDLFAVAAAADHERVVCEVNLAPPNLASDAFHAALKFHEVGRAVVYGGSKTVRYFERRL